MDKIVSERIFVSSLSGVRKDFLLAVILVFIVGIEVTRNVRISRIKAENKIKAKMKLTNNELKLKSLKLKSKSEDEIEKNKVKTKRVAHWPQTNTS